MSVESLQFLIEEFRIQAMERSAEFDIPAEETLEWSLADTLDAIHTMVADAIKQGGPAGEFAARMTAELLRLSLSSYGE